jgi:hypothetical protein
MYVKPKILSMALGWATLRKKYLIYKRNEVKESSYDSYEKIVDADFYIRLFSSGI